MKKSKAFTLKCYSHGPAAWIVYSMGASFSTAVFFLGLLIYVLIRNKVKKQKTLDNDAKILIILLIIAFVICSALLVYGFRSGLRSGLQGGADTVTNCFI